MSGHELTCLLGSGIGTGLRVASMALNGVKGVLEIRQEGMNVRENCNLAAQ